MASLAIEVMYTPFSLFAVPAYVKDSGLSALVRYLGHGTDDSTSAVAVSCLGLILGAIGGLIGRRFAIVETETQGLVAESRGADGPQVANPSDSSPTFMD